jgi:long-chain fatty acid transport protein
MSICSRKFLPLVMTTILSTGLFAGGAQAAGFFLQEQSVSAMGAAYAGSAAIARDPSAIFYNPAALTQLRGGQIHVGGNYLYPKANFDDRGSTLVRPVAPGPVFGVTPVGGVDSDDPIDGTLIPNLYYSQQINDVVWLGLGLSVPFGLSSEFDPGWYGRFDSIKTDLQTINIQPTVAFKVNDWLSVGGGIDIQLADAELTSAVYNGTTEGLSKLEGDDHSFGWNIGVTLKPWETTTIGLHHRSSISHELDGRIVVTGVGAQNVDQAGTARLDLPSITTLGLAHDVTDRLTLLAQTSYFEWSSFQSIAAVLNVNGAVTQDVVQKYKDTMNFSIGAEYDWSDALTFRVGYQYDESPANDTYRTTRTPDADRNWFTGGVTYRMNDRFTLDFSAAYIHLDDANINLTRNTAPLTAVVSTERNDSWIGIAAAGVTYKF